MTDAKLRVWTQFFDAHQIAGRSVRLFAMRDDQRAIYDSEFFPVFPSCRRRGLERSAAVARSLENGLGARGRVSLSIGLNGPVPVRGNVPNRRLGFAAGFEPPYHLGQFFRLQRQGMAGGRGLLHHGGVLLGHLIHLVDCGVDLSQSGRLFLSGCGDLGDQGGDLSHLFNDPFQRLSRLAHQADARAYLLPRSAP